MTKIFLVFGVALFVLTACSATGPQYHQEPIAKGMAQIVVYRPDVSFGQLGGARLLVHDNVVCSLKKNTHAILNVQPQPVTLSTRMWDDILTSNYEVNPKAGSRTFVRLTMNEANVYAGAIGGAMGSMAASNEGAYILRKGYEQEASLTKRICQ